MTELSLAARITALGLAVFALVSFVELVPFLGPLGGLLEAIAWIWLAAFFVRRSRHRLARLDRPALAGMAWSAAIGAATAVGGVAFSGGLAFVGFAGLSVASIILGLLCWPFLGAAVGGLSALVASAVRA